MSSFVVSQYLIIKNTKSDVQQEVDYEKVGTEKNVNQIKEIKGMKFLDSSDSRTAQMIQRSKVITILIVTM